MTSGWPRPPVVGRSDHAACPPPLLEDALDRRRSESRPVGEDDDRRLDLGPERGEPAAQRRAWPSLPVGAGDEPSRRQGTSSCVRALDDDDLVDRRLAQALEHAGKQDPLLGAPEPRRLAGGEDDRGDAPISSPSTVTLRDDDRLRRRAVCRTPSASMRIDGVHALRHLADDRVVGRAARLPRRPSRRRTGCPTFRAPRAGDFAIATVPFVYFASDGGLSTVE